MPTTECKCCGLSEVEIDTSRGASVCISCGAVLEESTVISEVQFEENAHGVSSAIGQFVSSDSSGANFRKLGKFYRPTTQNENRESTILRAKRAMQFISKQLKIDDHMLEQAVNFYRMALSSSLTKGRPSFLVYATCLYCVCRLERTPHLLIDFCDLLQLNIFSLGHTCSVLTRKFSISLPYTDPCIYLLRYASQLNFDTKTHDVYVTALRILKRMKRDSLHYGRLPAGLCGAALLLSARYHNFSRDLKSVVKVVRIHEGTLKKRLLEFGETPSSDLTVDDFLKIDLDEEQDPPSFREAHLKDIRHIQKVNVEYRKKLRLLEAIIDKYVDRRRKKNHTNIDEHINGVIKQQSTISEDEFSADDPDTEEEVEEEEDEEDCEKMTDDGFDKSSKRRKKMKENTLGSKKLRKLNKNKLKNKDNFELDAEDENAARNILEAPAEALDSCVETDCDEDDDNHNEDEQWEHLNRTGLEPTPETLGFGKVPDELLKNSTDGITLSEGMDIPVECSADVMNDEETTLYLVSESERTLKRKMWLDLYGSYMEEKSQKRLASIKAREEAGKETSSDKKTTKSKQRRKTGADNDGSSTGLTEVIDNVLKAKKVSSKINYEVLKSLNLPDFPAWEEKHLQKTSLNSKTINRKAVSRSNAIDDVSTVSSSSSSEQKTSVGKLTGKKRDQQQLEAVDKFATNTQRKQRDREPTPTSSIVTSILEETTDSGVFSTLGSKVSDYEDHDADGDDDDDDTESTDSGQDQFDDISDVPHSSDMQPFWWTKESKKTGNEEGEYSGYNTSVMMESVCRDIREKRLFEDNCDYYDSDF